MIRIWIQSQCNLFHSKQSSYEKVRAYYLFCQTWKILWLGCWLGIRTAQSAKMIFHGIFLEYSHKWFNRIMTFVGNLLVIGIFGGPMRGWHMASPGVATCPLKGQLKFYGQAEESNWWPHPHKHQALPLHHTMFLNQYGLRIVFEDIAVGVWELTTNLTATRDHKTLNH